ncbi:glycosyltransferase family 4 protein, partial [candidate division WOR-3 bacterium]|nr:glycosyltransferase family 4 protein [candidate division WOR-3 bacterium]
MKILVLTTLHAPNDDRIFYKETLSLRRKFSDITLVAPDHGEKGKVTDSRIRCLTLRQRGGVPGRFLKLLAAARAVWRIRPDIVHFHDYDILLVAPAMRYLLRCHLVYDAHEDYPSSVLISRLIPRALRRLAARAAKFFELAAGRACSLIITADPWTAEYLSRTGVSTCVVFNYPPLQLFAGETSRESSRQDAGTDRTVLLYQGTMSEERGLFHMIDAMPSILLQRPDCRLLLIGLTDAGLRSEAEALAAHLGVGEALEIIAWVPHTELHGYIEQSKIGLIPWLPVDKHKHNIPIKLFEYMACGLPVLAADLPSIRPYMDESKAGLQYDSTSSRALAEGVLRMLSDEDGLRRMGDNGRRAVQEKWNWGRMEERLLAAYDELEVRVRQRR